MSDVVFFRPEEYSREERTLPAELYNLARLMVMKSPAGHVFVPIRSMQYLAVLDDEEFIFVDGNGRRVIEISWRRFRPSDRSSLEDAVPFEAIYYSPGAAEIMQRLQGDFVRALELLASRQEKPDEMAKVIPMKPRN